MANIIFTPDIIAIKGRDLRYLLDLTVQEVPISPYFKNKGKIKPISFELLYNSSYDIVAKDIINIYE